MPCFDGDEALERLEREPCDMIITDVMMPGTDGFALAAAVRRTDKKIPILFMTALDDMPARERGYTLGADDYVVKPFDADILMLRVGALLRRADIERSRELKVGNLTMNSDEHSAYVDGGAAADRTGIRSAVQAAVVSQTRVHARAADGRVLGLRLVGHIAHGGRVHVQTAGQDGGVRRVRNRHRARVGV